VVAGAGAAGTLAAAVAVLPRVAPQAAAVAQATAPLAEGDGGYQLTDHVKRYYQTARV
jgi:hypothetical protein